MHQPLTDAELAAFHRDGFVVLPSLFAGNELARLRDAADRIFELAVNATVALGRRYPRMDARLDDDGTLTLRKIQPVNDLSDVIAAVATDERLIAPMRQLMRDEPVLMEEKLNFKQSTSVRGLDLACLHRSSFNSEVGLEGFLLHHDWGYYRMQGYPDTILSSAVAIDECAGRGPIRAIPGSHRLDVPMADPNPASGSGVVAAGFFDVTQLVPIDAPPGSVMLFHSKLVHDSLPNRSRLPRRLMIYSHYPKCHDPDGDPDRRNGPTRRYAQAFEAQYRALLANGSYHPRFVLAPSSLTDAPATTPS